MKVYVVGYDAENESVVLGVLGNEIAAEKWVKVKNSEGRLGVNYWYDEFTLGEVND